MSRTLYTKFSLLILTIFIVSPVSCNLPSTTLPEPRSQLVSLLLQTDSPIFIKRDGWKNYQPAGFGMLIYSSDLLKTDGNSTLLCADLQTLKHFTGRGRNPCPLASEEFALKYEDMLFSPSHRGSSAFAIPTIVSPRSTTILDEHPLLRWEETGATGYSVEIRQEGETIWRVENITGQEVNYPSAAAPLVAGNNYLLVVTDIYGRSSLEDDEKGLGFQIVSPEQSIEIEAKQTSILKLDQLDDSARKMALAMYYSSLRIGGRGLWSDAFVLLEEVSQIRPDEPVVFLRLGDALAKMALWAKADQAYSNAISLAKRSGDLETQADALAAVWRIDPSDQSSFEEAITLYNKIGATSKAEELQREAISFSS